MAGELTSVTVEGAEQLNAKFLDLSQAVKGAVMRRGFRVAGNVVLKDARSRVPVDEGNLKRSLRLSVRVRRDGWSYARVVARRRGGRYDGSHAAFVELGTVHMAAQPFMRPAIDTNQRHIRDAFVNALNEETNKRVERMSA